MEYRVSAHIPESMLTWGKVNVLGDSLLTAGGMDRLQIQVIVEQHIPEAHAIEVWTHFVSDIQRVQDEDPASPACFHCQSNDVSMVPFTRPDAKVHGPGSYFPYRRYAGIQLPNGARPGAEFTFTFDRVQMQTYEETLFNLRFAILQKDELIGYLGDAFFAVKGSVPAFLRVVAPTCVEVGEPFDCQIIVCDRYGNKSGDPLDDLVFELETDVGPNSVSYAEVVYDADKRRHTVRGAICGSDGIYYLCARVRDAPSVSGTSNPIVARQKWDERIYWGDMHQHAYFGDGRGTPAANYEYAIATSCLDFCAVVPHQEATFGPAWLHIPSPAQKGWEEMVEAAEAYDGQDLVTILGSEASSLDRIAGHMNAYYMDVTNRPELQRLGIRSRDVYKEILLPLESYKQYLKELERSTGDYLLLPHAHARGGPGVFDMPILPDYQTNIEICSVHGIFEEFYMRWLENGHFVGVHGGGDNHMTSTGNANPGYHYPNTNGLAAAFASERTRRGVWDAFKKRKTYAVTASQRIYVFLSVDGHTMGSVVANRGTSRTVQAQIAGTAPVMKVEVFKNNQVVYSFRPQLSERRTLRLAWTDSWNSRRVDDSLTTGRISLPGGGLSLISCLNNFHRTDAFTPEKGEIAFRSNGYSGITRGALVALSGAKDTLHYEIRDTHLGKTVLEEKMAVALSAEHTRLTRKLDVEERFIRPNFTRAPECPSFTLDVAWIDPNWSKVVALDWRDPDPGPGYYYVRAEQIDGNIAWSSPVWFLDHYPEGL